MNATTTPTPRQQVGLQAGWQTEALLRVLLTAAHSTDPEELSCLVEALVPRLLQLNSVAMAANDPGSDTAASMREELHCGYAHLVQASASNEPTNPCTGCRDNFPLLTGPMDVIEQWAVNDFISRRTACTLRPAGAKPCLPDGGAA